MQFTNVKNNLSAIGLAVIRQRAVIPGCKLSLTACKQKFGQLVGSASVR